MSCRYLKIMKRDIYMIKNVFLTRSLEENLILVKKIKELKLHPILAPMLSYEKLQYDFGQFENYKNIIITSKFAAKMVSEDYPYEVNAFVVGEESAEILKRNGKINVQGVYDNVEELIENRVVIPAKALVASRDLMRSRVKPGMTTLGLGMTIKKELGPRFRGDDGWSDDDNTFLYLSGNHISQEIPFAHRHIIYNTHYSKELPSEVVKIMEQSRADFIMLYSKNSASNFIDLVKRYKSLQNLQNSVVIAISEEVADIVKAYVQDVFFPKKPDADEMILILKKI